MFIKFRKLIEKAWKTVGSILVVPLQVVGRKDLLDCESLQGVHSQQMLY